MISGTRHLESFRSKFDRIYDTRIVGGGFFESDQYYRNDKERYWRTLQFLCRAIPHAPAKILEIGGGQIALLCKELFGDDCTVGDISEEFIRPIAGSGINFIAFNLTDIDTKSIDQQYDAIILLEVIEHVPIPAYVLMERLKPLLASKGIIFLTTPNLFRIRNLVRMFLGIEFLDRIHATWPASEPWPSVRIFRRSFAVALRACRHGCFHAGARQSWPHRAFIPSAVGP